LLPAFFLAGRGGERRAAARVAIPQR
jgi:hypothetical protein